MTEVKSHVSFPWSLGDDKHMKAERERTNPQNIIHFHFYSQLRAMLCVDASHFTLTRNSAPWTETLRSSCTCVVLNNTRDLKILCEAVNCVNIVAF